MGIVHLEGLVLVGKEVIYIGSLSQSSPFHQVSAQRMASSRSSRAEARAASASLIAGSDASFEGHSLSGTVVGSKEGQVELSGITFRAQS